MALSLNFDGYIDKIDVHPPSPGSGVIDLTDFVLLCIMTYDDGWFEGGMPSMASVQNDKLFITPDKINENGLTLYDIFVFDVANKRKMQWPKYLQPTPCATLFCLILAETENSTVVHTHSPAANMIASLINAPFFEIAYRDYLKNLYLPNPDILSNTDFLRIPIIENNATETELFADIKRVVTDKTSYPAAIVRNSGIFVWGKTWEEVDMKYRALDIIFNAAIGLIREKNNPVFDCDQEMKPAIHDHSDSFSLPSVPLLVDFDYYAAQAVNSLSLYDADDYMTA